MKQPRSLSKGEACRAQTSLTPDSHGAIFSSGQDLGLTFPHAYTVHVVCVTLQN